MLVHPWDEAAEDEWAGHLEGHAFGQLVTAGSVDGYPVVVPTHFSYLPAERVVLLHLARPNPVWRALDQDPHVVLTVVADYAYVESAWNAGTEVPVELGVPTSYYSAVQLRGVAEVVDAPDALAALLAHQLADLEPPGSRRRRPSTATASDRRLLPGIRGVRITVAQVLAKAKYGGNRSVEHRLAVAERLEGRGGALDGAAARRVRDRSPAGGTDR